MVELWPMPSPAANIYNYCFMRTDSPTPVLIADDQSLKSCSQQWRQLSAVAVDTEFVRTDTFYAKLGLIQLSDGDQCWLIDPLAVSDLSPLTQMFRNPAITKIFHAPSEDLEILMSALDCLPAPLFDTQVAAALTGFGFSRGYAALVKTLLAVELDKHETRSDWVKRPLTNQQLHYASEDVYYLAALYPLLHSRLEQMNRSPWMAEEMQSLLMKSAEAEDADSYYLKIKAAWQLDRSRLQLLQRLCSWREREARQRDRPRNRIVADKLLFEIARTQPGTIRELRNLEGVHPRTVRVFGETLIGLVAKAGGDSCHHLEPVEQPLPKSAAPVLKKLRATVLTASQEHDLPPEVLATRRDLETIARSIRENRAQLLPDKLLTGWRFRVVGASLLDLAQHIQQSTSHEKTL